MPVLKASRFAVPCVFPLCLALTICQALPSAAQQVRAGHGMVASSNSIASQVGVDILKRGGNAVDAACAVGLALAVTHPTAGNLGGGGFMLIRLKDGRSVAIDYRETAPEAASRTMYLDSNGRIIPQLSLVGYRAAGVPGTVAGFGMAQKKYGALTWREVVEPARKLAADGFRVSDALASDLRSSKNLAKFSESKRIFLNSGMYYSSGDIFKQPDLAATLKRIQQQGPREFYTGATAKLIVEDMKANGGLITAADLEGYKAIERVPLRGTYRGYEVLTMPPPSSGGAALLEMLNILEPHNLNGMGTNSVQTDHLLIEAMRRAFADRSEYMGDPDFVTVPAKGIISKRYAADVARSIDPIRATPSTQIGHGNPAPYESTQTTHFSVVDAAGNAVSNTYTLNMGYGSCATIKGAGFLLNDEMDDFTSKPGTPNGFGLIQGEANAIGPRKRPLSSMTPTILTRDGKLFLVIGSPGGPTIINTVLQVISNVVDHRMSVGDAIAAKRIHHQWLPDEVTAEPNAIPVDLLEKLQDMGHRVSRSYKRMGDAEGILIDLNSGVRFGASDPRSRDAAAIGY